MILTLNLLSSSFSFFFIQCLRQTQQKNTSNNNNKSSSHPMMYAMIHNCRNLLMTPTFLLLICTILGVSYSKNTPNTVLSIADILKCHMTRTTILVLIHSHYLVPDIDALYLNTVCEQQVAAATTTTTIVTAATTTIII